MAARTLMVFGPSGVGKTFLGEHLSTVRGWRHVNLDDNPAPGVDPFVANGLQQEWNQLHYQYNAGPMAATLGARGSDCVLSFSSLVIEMGHIKSVERTGLQVVLLWGPPELCLESFRQREAKDRGLQDCHWRQHNEGIYKCCSASIFDPWRIDAFSPNGGRRHITDIVAEIDDRAGKILRNCAER